MLNFMAIVYFEERERAGYFTVFVFLMSCDCLCYLAVLHGTVGWSAVCNCGNFLSFLLTF